MSRRAALSAASLVRGDKPRRGSRATPATIKEPIREQFGDGIMSAINVRLDVRRAADPAGDRDVVTPDGKFLPYQW